MADKIFVDPYPVVSQDFSDTYVFDGEISDTAYVGGAIPATVIVNCGGALGGSAITAVGGAVSITIIDV